MTPIATPAPSSLRRRLAACAALLLALVALPACDRGEEAQPVAATTDAAPVETPPAPQVQGPLHAVFEGPSGSFRVRLEHEATPRLCANFVNLVSRGFYEGMPWIDFSPVVRQTGAVSVAEDPGYTLPREFSPKLLFDVGGRLCASNTTDDDNTARAKPTRIFITVKPQERWNLKYAIFGTIVDGLEVAKTLIEGERIRTVTIEGDPSPLLARYADTVAGWNAALDRTGM